MAHTQRVSPTSLPAMITCECGDILTRSSVEDNIRCDNCDKTLKPSLLAYRCPKQHCYCLKCSAYLLSNKNNKGLIKPIHCECGQTMILTLPNEVYSNAAVHCNNIECTAIIGKMEYCYHCPIIKSSQHPNGFDYCMKCAKQKSNTSYDSYRRSKINNEVSTSMDAITMQSLTVNPMALSDSINVFKLKQELDIMEQNYVYLKRIIVKNIPILCKCKTRLILTAPQTVYRAPALCDYCQAQIDQNGIVFHCPKHKIDRHKGGFDVCLDCAIGDKQKYEEKLNHYQDIIQPSILTMFEQNGTRIRKSAHLITEIMPFVMDSQNVALKEVMKRVNGEEEIPGIAQQDIEEKNESDSSVYDENVPLLRENKMPQLSLAQLYGMRNTLNDCCIKHESMKGSLNVLLESINCKIIAMESEWESWDADDIVDWIILLENGRFKKYEEILRHELCDGDATGKVLPALDISDWRKSFEITKWDDAIALNKYKNTLVANKREEQHIYPSPFDPQEEGADTK